MNNKVRVGSLYAYYPTILDQCDPPKGAHIEEGQIVRVINLRGCPPANTMGHCYIETSDTKGAEFLGMVCTNSLKPLIREGKKYFLKEKKIYT